MKKYIAVFGSRVLDDGSPSGSLLRRTKEAYRLSLSLGHPFFLLTGGSTKEGIPSEALVMKNILLEKGVSEAQITCDYDSTDTLESVLAISQMLSNGTHVYVCSDNYHVMRITMLLRMLGLKASALWIESGRSNTGTINWIYMWLRDLVAALYDGLIVIKLTWLKWN